VFRLSIPELVVFVILAFFLLLPIYWDWRVIRVLWHHSVRTIAPPTYLPRATALLSLRGADPSLVDCLGGLLNQDYPQYDVCNASWRGDIPRTSRSVSPCWPSTAKRAA
jgi:hypothetical protein